MKHCWEGAADSKRKRWGRKKSQAQIEEEGDCLIKGEGIRGREKKKVGENEEGKHSRGRWGELWASIRLRTWNRSWKRSTLFRESRIKSRLEQKLANLNRRKWDK